MNIHFTELTESDFEWIKDIYDFYIEHSTAAYYTGKISIDELKEFIPLHHSRYKSYAIKADLEYCGFCYYGQYKKRQAYDRTAEISLYLKPEYTGKGIGKAALEFLESKVKNICISVLLGIISGDNENSIKNPSHNEH